MLEQLLYPQNVSLIRFDFSKEAIVFSFDMYQYMSLFCVKCFSLCSRWRLWKFNRTILWGYCWKQISCQSQWHRKPFLWGSAKRRNASVSRRGSRKIRSPLDRHRFWPDNIFNLVLVLWSGLQYRVKLQNLRY